MTTDAFLEVNNGNYVNAVREFLKNLLANKLVDAVLVPVELPSGQNTVQTLVSNPEKLEKANPFAPVLPVNSARILSAMTKKQTSNRKMAAVLKPCELRAVVELVKLKQVSLENVVLIGLDCFGTYSVSDYLRLAREGESPSDHHFANIRSGNDDTLVREACRVCEYPYPVNADIIIGLFGVDSAKELMVRGMTEEGISLIQTLGLPEWNGGEKRQSAIDEIVKDRIAARDGLFEKTSHDIAGPEKLLPVFESCVNCHNCRDACPICYCKECLFDSPTFEFGADKYFDWAERREALRMPTDTLLFHLTRLNHMASSCVGCGLCQEACPNDVPVFSIFRLVGDRVQSVFGYVPGRSVDEEMPLSTFREDELQEVGYE
jgi:formate dehydrogenase subunit beta